ncbi:sensor histidine kinase [Filimonas effusa]|uniref:histidine kinase n=1 Tax=Filimonas effusa TaxID=2508721 RepID=A0A4Q1D5P5_9BACT|nr:HAMP domain-containing sensor histidine kinase [Filimonas effusa]RXK82981.1 HAMP domain-containing histidine kinase [Filimonas effusa]
MYAASTFAFVNRLISSGTHSDMPLDEVKRTKLTNICVLSCMPVTTFFLIVNLLKQYYTLGFINLAILAGGATILYINYQRRYYLARLLLLIVSNIIFTVSSILYHNGGEHFLLLTIILAVILYNNKWFIYIFSGITAIAYIWVYIEKSRSPIITNVGGTRAIINLAMMLLLFIISLNYFKQQHLHHQQVIEKKNKALYDQKIQLLAQKDALEENNQMLGELNRTKEKLFSIIAHDMRSPLGSLRGSLDLLQQRMISAAEFEQIAAILIQQVDDLQASQENLLQWSRSQLTGISVKEQLVSLRKLAEEKTAFLQPQAVKKDILIRIDITDQALVKADMDHCSLILRNLLTNAIKFSPVGGLIIVSSQAHKNFVCLSISDQGIGISQAQLDLLNSGSVNVSTRGTSNEKGTGLGLLLCKEFLEKNGGRLEITANHPKGSVVSFLLPIAS